MKITSCEKNNCADYDHIHFYAWVMTRRHARSSMRGELLLLRKASYDDDMIMTRKTMMMM
jgi:hypothetical protein